MAQLKTTVNPLKFKEFNFIRRFFIIALCLCIVIKFVLSLTLLPAIQRDNFLNYSYIFEVLGLLSLLFIFWLVQCAPLLCRRAHILLSVGLFSWILSVVADVSDEIVIQPLWLSLWGEDFLRTLGMITCMVGILVTIKNISLAYDHVKKLSTIDDLTQLPNRRYFYQMLKHHENDILLVMLIDLDHFKKVNDQYGHERGDICLNLFGEMLSKNTIANTFSARLGGEEFAVFITSNNKNQATKFAQKILKETRNITLENTEHLTVSIGIALKSPSETSDNVLRRADEALYKAKDNGRNRLEWSCIE
ncbi:GGDEF domain-containing protein [Photobacterium alginatilyticum]|uniref:GGDEF domain-containing protein n=1 Tax=Photobacterium alginatilyticum TaxID=1775171 RepID=UPI0040680127